jgi:hypothetical protein
LRFADVAGIDLAQAGLRKLERNAAKYPAHERSPDPADTAARPVVCGIDAGTLKSLSYVAWLRGSEFLLTTYRPTAGVPLPQTPPGWAAPAAYALDLPQGLPAPGEKRRKADAEAATPTSVLPSTRAALMDWKLHRGFIEAGVEMYWRIHSAGLGRIAGLGGPADERPLVAETYPRYVLKRKWPDFAIPSKRKAPESYTNKVWSLLQAEGFRSQPEPTRPDDVDAMLCALAARACLEHGGKPQGTVGAAPYTDNEERIVREGYIVAP